MQLTEKKSLLVFKWQEQDGPLKHQFIRQRTFTQAVRTLESHVDSNEMTLRQDDYSPIQRPIVLHSCFNGLGLKCQFSRATARCPNLLLAGNFDGHRKRGFKWEHVGRMIVLVKHQRQQLIGAFETIGSGLMISSFGQTSFTVREFKPHRLQ